MEWEWAATSGMERFHPESSLKPPARPRKGGLGPVGSHSLHSDSAYRLTTYNVFLRCKVMWAARAKVHGRPP